MVDLIPHGIPTFIRVPIRGMTQPLAINFEYVQKKELSGFPIQNVDLIVYYSNKEKEPD